LKVDIKAKETLKNPVSWSFFRDFPESLLLRKQPRLSVVPIEATLWPKILRLANGESV